MKVNISQMLPERKECSTSDLLIRLYLRKLGVPEVFSNLDCRTFDSIIKTIAFKKNRNHFTSCKMFNTVDEVSVIFVLGRGGKEDSENNFNIYSLGPEDNNAICEIANPEVVSDEETGLQCKIPISLFTSHGILNSNHATKYCLATAEIDQKDNIVVNRYGKFAKYCVYEDEDNNYKTMMQVNCKIIPEDIIGVPDKLLSSIDTGELDNYYFNEITLYFASKRYYSFDRGCRFARTDIKSLAIDVEDCVPFYRTEFKNITLRDILSTKSINLSFTLDMGYLFKDNPHIDDGDEEPEEPTPDNPDEPTPDNPSEPEPEPEPIEPDPETGIYTVPFDRLGEFLDSMPENESDNPYMINVTDLTSENITEDNTGSENTTEGE